MLDRRTIAWASRHCLIRLCLAGIAVLAVAGLSSPAPRIALAASGEPDGESYTLRDAVSRVDSAASSASAEIGVAVLDRGTNQLTLGANGRERFFSASVVKLFTVVDIMHRTEKSGTTLTAAQRGQVQRALHVSDNAAMTALWTAFGGTRTITELVSLVDLQDTAPPSNPGMWGETQISARDVVAVYQFALNSLSPADQDLLFGSLATPGVAGSGGFNQSFGVLRTPGLPGATGKQGWMVDKGSMYLHSTGTLGTDRRYLVAVLSKQGGSVGYPAGRQRLNSAVVGIAQALNLDSSRAPDSADTSDGTSQPPSDAVIDDSTT